MKKIKAIALALVAISVSINVSLAQTYNYEAAKKIKIKNLAAVGGGEEKACDDFGQIGDVDCLGRLYVDNIMLSNLVNDQPVESNDGEVFASYADDKINTTHVFYTFRLFMGKEPKFKITGWNVENINSVAGMFEDSVNFNQDISGWNFRDVKNMDSMFKGATSFNQDISDWDVSNVTDMDNMFNGASSFNQDIGKWNTRYVRYVSGMFANAISFNQDISMWPVSPIMTTCEGFSINSPLLEDNLPNYPDWCS